MNSKSKLEIQNWDSIDAPRMYAREIKELPGVADVILVDRYNEWGADRMINTICDAAHRVGTIESKPRIPKDANLSGTLDDAITTLSVGMRDRLSKHDPSTINFVRSHLGNIDERLYTHDELPWVSIQSGRAPYLMINTVKEEFAPNHYLPVGDIVNGFGFMSEDLGWRWIAKCHNDPDYGLVPIVSQSRTWNGMYEHIPLQENHKEEINRVLDDLVPALQNGGCDQLTDETTIRMQSRMVGIVYNLEIPDDELFPLGRHYSP